MPLTLIPDSDSRLHTRADEVTDLDEVRTVADEMFAFMDEKGGIGLAASQVGIAKRFFIVRCNGLKLVVINPVILEKSEDEEAGVEGCLSYPGERYIVSRAKEIRVRYKDLTGRDKTTRFKGIMARVFQHENDHLDGVVIPEKGIPYGSRSEPPESASAA